MDANFLLLIAAGSIGLFILIAGFMDLSQEGEKAVKKAVLTMVFGAGCCLIALIGLLGLSLSGL